MNCFLSGWEPQLEGLPIFIPGSFMGHLRFQGNLISMVFASSLEGRAEQSVSVLPVTQAV